MKRLSVPAQYLPVFCRELYQLVRSGIPIAEGLAMLREDETDRDTRSWLDALCRSTEEGTPLSAALRETEAFPAYMTDMVALAEETGRLEDTLLSLQRHYDRQLRMAADIRGAVTVPVTLFAVMVAVVVLLVTQVLPVFDRVFAQLGVRMGAVATGMMNAGAVLAKAGTGLAVVLVLIAAAALVVALAPALREKFTGWFRRSFGGRGILGQMAVALLKLAEQTGSLPETLEDLASRQEEAGLRSIDRMVGAIEPAIVVITSALAGVILLSVMLPLMGLLSTIG